MDPPPPEKCAKKKSKNFYSWGNFWWNERRRKKREIEVEFKELTIKIAIKLLSFILRLWPFRALPHYVSISCLCRKKVTVLRLRKLDFKWFSLLFWKMGMSEVTTGGKFVSRRNAKSFQCDEICEDWARFWLHFVTFSILWRKVGECEFQWTCQWLLWRSLKLFELFLGSLAKFLSFENSFLEKSL